MGEKMKKKIVLVIVGIIIIFAIGILGYYMNQEIQKKNENNRLISEIKNSYSEFVTSIEAKKVYKKTEENYQEIGTIYPNIVLSLEEKEVTSKEDIYYHIKDTEYYIDYQAIKSVESPQFDTTLDSYLVTKIIKTTNPKLYQGEELMIELTEPFTFDVLMIEEEKYYVKFLNQIYYIKEDYEIVEKDVPKNLLKDISVFNFSNDISDTKLDEVLKYLSENNYETISIEDFIRWISGKVNLEEKKILLLSYKELEESKLNLLKQYGYFVFNPTNIIEFTSGDTKLKIGDTKYYRYEIDSTTTLDRVTDMLNGVKEAIQKNQGIAVLNYHFFYDGNKESCNETICLDISNFRKQLDYLKNNGYKTLTMQEFNDWMDRKISLPQKSVLLTVDDGAMGTSKINGNKLIPILEEYQMHATLFLITGWWDVANYQSEYLEVYSHGDELHHNNFCRNGSCGFKGLYLSKEELVQDLNISIQKLGKSLAFCYPFYAKNNTMAEALQETGFELAFIGGNKKATQSNNKYSIPRYVVYKNTSLNSFIQMIS